MKIAACFLVLSAGVCSATLADEPQSPATQTPAAQTPGPPTPAPQTPAAQSAAQSTAAQTTAASALDSPSDTKPAPGAPAVPAPKADTSEVVNVAATEAQIKQMRGRGYKPVNRNGTLVFCRDEGEIGTHFQRTHCSTLKQLKDAELSGKEFVNSLQQQGSAVPFKGP
jgi:glucose/arabinose dehydrogenase